MDFLEPQNLLGEEQREVLPLDFKSALNSEQYAAVTASDGPALVLAGAGSGKTRTLTYRVAWLLSQGVKPWEILLLTFTNKAAKEMLSRVEELTAVPRYHFWGGTFHHIGQKILRMHGEGVGVGKSFTIMDAGEADSFLGEVTKDLDPKFSKEKNNPKPRVLSDIISFSRNTCRNLSAVIKESYPYYGHLQEGIEAFAKEYKKRKLVQQILDYDDLLELWLKLLRENASVLKTYQARFRYILVDEYQDTNTLQSSIIDLLAEEHQVMAVGDDSQCIYTWRGASFENIMTFPHRHPGTLIHKIETNYRSTPEILNFANGILRHQPVGSGYAKELRAIRASGMKPWVVPVMDTRQQAQFILKRISALLEEGHRLSDMAVLYRAHFHAMDLQMELSRQGVAYQITSGVRFFEQAHVKDLVSMLRFVSNPQDSIAFGRFMGLLPKVGPKTVDKLLKHIQKVAKAESLTLFQVLDRKEIIAKVPESAREDWVDIAYTLQDMAESLDKKAPSELVSMALTGWYGGFMRTLYTNWSSREEDLESLVGFAERYPSMPELLAQLVLLSSETSDRSVDPLEDMLRLTTVHQAKGLEFPIVFIIGVAQHLFPLKRAVEAGDVEEERRLFYVAVTRARDQLYLTQPRVTTQGGPPTLLEPSAFIKELAGETYEELRVPMHFGR